ncbi:hypothetical protein SRHO_G00030960 [Serrasalmus rhombeus]
MSAVKRGGLEAMSSQQTGKNLNFSGKEADECHVMTKSESNPIKRNWSMDRLYHFIGSQEREGSWTRRFYLNVFLYFFRFFLLHRFY